MFMAVSGLNSRLTTYQEPVPAFWQMSLKSKAFTTGLFLIALVNEFSLRLSDEAGRTFVFSGVTIRVHKGRP